MNYPSITIPDTCIPGAANPLFQHLLDTYVSESNKVASTWESFTDSDLSYSPHPRSSTVGRDPPPSTPLRASLLRGVSGNFRTRS